MKILYEEQFKIALKDIVSYIKKDNPSASLNFKKELNPNYALEIHYLSQII